MTQTKKPLAQELSTEVPPQTCCAVTELGGCCDPSQKTACCGQQKDAETRAPAACGCR